MDTSKSKAFINGVIVGGRGLNVEAMKESVRKEHEVVDAYGKANTVSFEEGEDRSGRYVRYWVTQG